MPNKEASTARPKHVIDNGTSNKAHKRSRKEVQNRARVAKKSATEGRPAVGQKLDRTSVKRGEQVRGSPSVVLSKGRKNGRRDFDKRPAQEENSSVSSGSGDEESSLVSSDPADQERNSISSESDDIENSNQSGVAQEMQRESSSSETTQGGTGAYARTVAGGPESNTQQSSDSEDSVILDEYEYPDQCRDPKSEYKPIHSSSKDDEVLQNLLCGLLERIGRSGQEYSIIVHELLNDVKRELSASNDRNLLSQALIRMGLHVKHRVNTCARAIKKKYQGCSATIEENGKPTQYALKYSVLRSRDAIYVHKV